MKQEPRLANTRRRERGRASVCGRCQTQPKLERVLVLESGPLSLVTTDYDYDCGARPFLGCLTKFCSQGPIIRPTFFLVFLSFVPARLHLFDIVHAGVSSSNPKRWIQQPLAHSPPSCRPSPRGGRVPSHPSASTRLCMQPTLPSCPTQRLPLVLLRFPQRPPTQTPSAGPLLADPIPET